METRLRYSRVSRRYTRERSSIIRTQSSKRLLVYTTLNVLERGLEVAELVPAQFPMLTALYCGLKTSFD